MEKAFLRQVALLFKDDDLQQYTFIFPNRRSSLFFLKHLGEVTEHPLFAPRMFTVDNLFSYLSDLEVADDLTLVFRLWKSYKELQSEKAESLDEFISWGTIILSDFNDIDQYMVNASQLLMNLKDIKDLQADSSFLEKTQLEALKKIGDFKDQLQEKDDTQRKFLSLWDMLLPLYDSFRESLCKDGLAYRGMQYRQVIENISKAGSDSPLGGRLDKLGKVVFIGFSAPTECEKHLMTYFRNRGGLFYWDYYSDMIRTEHNHSSKLISKCVKDFSNSHKNIDGGGGCVDCQFNIIPASGATEQAMVASRLLDMINKENVDDIETAIVVSDEILLLPLLEAIPQKDINITMGYPLKATSMASLFFSLSDLHLRSRRTQDGKILLPGEVLVSVLNHPYIKEIDSEAASTATEYIQGNNLYMVDSSELTGSSPLSADSQSSLAEILNMLPPGEGMYGGSSPDIVSAIIDYLRAICDKISSYLSTVERSFLNKFLEILERLSASGIKFSSERSVYSVIRSSIRTASVPFRGEPLKGLQVMGALETRALDFERIIFLSFNEGTYPTSGEKNSCLPYFLRKGFNLPTYENENSISSYNFYRLIQRASKVYMIYDTANTDRLKSKEESRFIKQLEYDFEKPLNVMNFHFPTPSSAKPSAEPVFLTEEDRRLLGNFFSDLREDNMTKDRKRAFSASSLNNYIDCPRKFLLSNVLRIRDNDELTDTVEANTFGRIFHYCMEHIYDDYSGGKGKTLSVNQAEMSKIRDMALSAGYLDSLISNAFVKEMKVRSIVGQNLIIKKGIEEYIRKTLKADCSKAKIPYTLIGNEVPTPKDLDEVFSFACFSGKIDRLEEFAGAPRICDYKTGQFLKSDRTGLSILEKDGFTCCPSPHYLPVKELGDHDFEKLLGAMFNKEKHRDKYSSIMFQMFVYAFLYRQINSKTSPVYLSVYQLPVIDKCGPVTIKITEDHLSRFSERLADLLKQIKEKALNPDSSIEACKAANENCKYCDFNKYCRRVAQNG